MSISVNNQRETSIRTQFIRWGPRLLLRWETPERLKEIGVHLQQWFGCENFWSAIPQIDKSWIHEHPEEHIVWLKFNPKPYRGYLIFFPYHGRSWSILLTCGEKPGAYELYFVKFRLHPDIYQGTWWVVELTPSTNPSEQWKLWLEDCWFMNGQDLRGMKPSERNIYAKKQMQEKWQPDSAIESVELKWKPVCSANQLPQMLNFVSQQSNINLNQARFWFISNTENKSQRDNVLKVYSWWVSPNLWTKIPEITLKIQNTDRIKQEEQKKLLEKVSAQEGLWKNYHTIFACWKTQHPDIYELSTNDKEGDHGHVLGRACVPNIQISNKINNWFNDSSNKQVIWVQCCWHNWFGRWVPIQLADEKDIMVRVKMPDLQPNDKPPVKYWLEKKKWFSLPIFLM